VTRHLFTAASVAALITITIFLVMLSLVWQSRSALGDRASRTVIEYVRIKRDSETETKARERPEKVALPEAPSLPTLRPADVAAPAHVDVPTAIPVFRPSFSIAGAPHLGGSPDMDVVPLLRVSPLYPPRAQARGVEGWVHLRFAITPQGTTKDVKVLGADPHGYFEHAAKSAVMKYKYKPKVEGGVPVERPGVEIVISFELNE